MTLPVYHVFVLLIGATVPAGTCGPRLNVPEAPVALPQGLRLDSCTWDPSVPGFGTDCVPFVKNWKQSETRGVSQ